MTNPNGLNGDTPRGIYPSERVRQVPAVPDIRPDDHEQMKDYLRPGLRDFCDGLLEGVAARDRTAMNLFPRIMGAIGAEREVSINVATTQAFGMPADEVRKIVDSYRQSSATTVDQCMDDGIALLRWCIDQEPACRGRILSELGGGGALALAETNGN